MLNDYSKQIDLIKTWRINGVKADILESLRNVTGLMVS